jgi:PEP-CTERM motif
MKGRITVFCTAAVLCMLLAAPAWGQDLYDNGPINGTTDAWTINFGYTVSDTMNLASAQTASGFTFGVWEFPGDTLSSVGWSMTSGENGGSIYGSGTTGTPGGGTLTDKFISTNQYGYNIDSIVVKGLSVGLPSGVSWLNLYNATVPSGDPVFWDENSGAGCKGNNGSGGGCPSSASESAVGTIPSESFSIQGGSPVPEPGSLFLLGSGMFSLMKLCRKKKV